MNKITVFWIEDNPIISNEENINGVKYPKLLHTDYFTYCLFQHPKQVEEYLSMLSKLLGNEEISSIAEKCPGALPDIVVFDYKLYDAFKRNINALQYSNAEHSDFLKKVSASQQLKDCYNTLFHTQELFFDREQVKTGNYMGDNFKREINADAIQADDEFGLYCGIAIVREFKEYITCGIPATINKADKSTMSYNSLFYEWLNSYDLKGAMERPVNDAENESKDWTHILPFSTDILRKRIAAQAQSNKITLDLTQLLEYVGGEIPAEQEKRIFTFQSVYGERHLPLDGLFIDVDAEKRKVAFKEWAITLLSLYKIDAYKTAKEVSETLIKAHKGTTIINNRIRLSELVVKLANIEALTTEENTELSALKDEFGINDNQINEAKEDKSVDIKNKARDYRDFKTKDNQTNRLVVLFTDLQLHFARQKFCEMNIKSNDEVGILSLLSSEPTLDDLRTALYPIPKNPLILPYHYHLLKDTKLFKKKEPFDVWEKPIGRDMGNDAIYSRGDYPKNLSDGEIELCKSFCLDLGLKMDYYPKWLTKKLLK